MASALGSTGVSWWPVDCGRPTATDETIRRRGTRRSSDSSAMPVSTRPARTCPGHYARAHLDEYFLGAGTTQQAAGAAAGDATTGNTDSERFLRAASRLGVLLCDAAYWNRPAGRCGWLGRTQDLAAFSTSSTPRPLAATLGPDLYNGLSGIALFLAELFAQTSDELFRRTALGAIAGARHQVRSKLAAGEPLGLGFFTGVSGVTYAARRVGSLTGSVEELPETRQMLVAALASARELSSDDIISGRAGAILTLLALDGDPAFAGSGTRRRTRTRAGPLTAFAKHVDRAGAWRGWIRLRPAGPVLPDRHHGVPRCRSSGLGLGGQRLRPC